MFCGLFHSNTFFFVFSAYDDSVLTIDHVCFINADFKRSDVTDLSNCSDKLSCTLPCMYIRLGTYCFEPIEPVNKSS